MCAAKASVATEAGFPDNRGEPIASRQLQHRKRQVLRKGTRQLRQWHVAQQQQQQAARIKQQQQHTRMPWLTAVSQVTSVSVLAVIVLGILPLAVGGALRVSLKLSIFTMVVSKKHCGRSSYELHSSKTLWWMCSRACIASLGTACLDST